jgi:glucose-1-phosphate adenylyltransferase
MNLNDDGPVYSICPSLTAEDQKGVVVNSLISPGCVIKGRVENSIISPGVYIDDKAVVRNSIVMAGSTIGNHSVVDRCIVDENVMISEYCYTGFDTGTFPEKRGITVLGRGAKVSAYTGTGRKCKVEPLAQPADFVSRLIRSGSLVANTFPKAG